MRARQAVISGVQILVNFFSRFLKIFFLARNILQSLRTPMVKTVFEDTKFLPLKIACKKRPYIRPWGRKFLKRFSVLKTSNFRKIVFIIRFLRLWRAFLTREQKLSEISVYLMTYFRSLYWTKYSCDFEFFRKMSG